MCRFSSRSEPPLQGYGTILQIVAAVRGGSPPIAWPKRHQLPDSDRRVTLECGGLIPRAARRLHPGECHSLNLLTDQRYRSLFHYQLQYGSGVFGRTRSQRGGIRSGGGGRSGGYGGSLLTPQATVY